MYVATLCVLSDILIFSFDYFLSLFEQCMFLPMLVSACPLNTHCVLKKVVTGLFSTYIQDYKSVLLLFFSVKYLIERV